MSNTGRPKYGMPTGKVRYEDSSGSGKNYVESDTQSTRTASINAPFGFDFMSKLFRGPKVTEDSLAKRQMTVTQKHAMIPVTDESGKRWNAHFFDVQYHPDGAMPAVAKSDGSTPTGSMPFMMIPGMEREKGEFATYSVPKSKMTREPSDFSYFTPFEEPKK